MKNIVICALMLLSATGCGKLVMESGLPDSASVAAETVDIGNGQAAIMLGGYGSSMAYNPAGSCFYLLTDRGPNVDGTTPESKLFPIPDYAPTIGRFRLSADSLLLIEKIILKDSAGRNFTGLPNAEGDGVTGEVAYNISGEIISNTGRGLDPEGLAIAPDGTFWISDEYAPFIMQFDRNGMLLRELTPAKGIPAYYANRRPNRGMEGLTISADGGKLYGIMQSPLYMPDKSTKDVSVNNRMIEIDLHSGATREFIYAMESPENVVSEILFIDNNTMLVLERDSEFPKNGKGFKKIYKIRINNATDVTDKNIELLSSQELKTQNISPVSKTLFVDILDAIPGYRHDKPEGIAMIGDSVICVVNDDDFGVTATPDGRFAPKLDAEGRLDKNVVYFITVK